MGVMPNIRQIIRFSKRIGRRETGPRREIAGGGRNIRAAACASDR